MSPVDRRARVLAGALEPFAGHVYFSPECHDNYVALGFAPSRAMAGRVALPDGPAYFCSRGSVMGQVPGELIASAFAVFNPAAVVPAVTYGWTLTDAATICQARTDGAVAQLTRILGEKPDGVDHVCELLARANGRLRPEGRPLYAGLLSLGLPGSPLADAWRLADQLREYRGDAHTAAWTSAGYDATEIGLMTELFIGLPPRTYVRTRAWSDADLDAAAERLSARGLLRGGAFTDKGRAEREAIEQTTDQSCQLIIEALADDFDELITLLLPWGVAIREAGGYLAGGANDLANAVRSGI